MPTSSAARARWRRPPAPRCTPVGSGNTEFPHVPVEDGDEIRVGALILRALWTPGHTPEHIAYLLIDPAQGSEPLALFSGDVLFTGEIGRPDLLGPEAQQAADRSNSTRRSQQRLQSLPDAVIVYPGHTAGSPCGKQIGDAPQTTMGQEKTFGYAFNQPDRETFIRVVMEGMPTAARLLPGDEAREQGRPDAAAGPPGRRSRCLWQTWRRSRRLARS